MTLKAKIIVLLLAGLLGGFLAWMAAGWTGWLNWTVSLPGMSFISGKQLALHRAEVGAMSMGLVGLLLGVADSFSFDRLADRIRAVAVILIAAAIGGALALQVGPAAPVLGMGLDSPSAPATPILASAQAMAAQGIVWAIVGLFIGLAYGLLRKSPLLIRQGAFGGLVGGLASGFVSRMLPQISSPVIAGVNSLPAFAIGGALVGLAIGGASYLFRIGSLFIVEGPNAGKEYLIGGPVTLIGSGRSCDLVLTRDASVASRQCSIEEDGDDMMLRSLSAEDLDCTTTELNAGAVAGRVPLKTGDEIRMGLYRIRFVSREQPASQTAPAPPEEQPQPSAEITTPVEIVLPTRRNGSEPDQHEITDRIPAGAPETVGLYRREEGARLVCMAGPYRGEVYLLGDAKQTTIGRGSDRDIALVDDIAASRDHAVILLANSVHVIRDDGSANGTLLNNLPLKPHTPHRLSPKDVIVVGRSVFQYEV